VDEKAKRLIYLPYAKDLYNAIQMIKRVFEDVHTLFYDISAVENSKNLINVQDFIE
jgi:hypothetical protein